MMRLASRKMPRTSRRATARSSACDGRKRECRNENDIQPARCAQGGNRAGRDSAVRRAHSRRRPAGGSGGARADRGDPDGLFASYRVYLCVMARNTDLVKAEDAPKSYHDLLDPKWAGKIVKAHPGYSGTILTATYQTARDVGWEYYEKLAKQRVMQVQSASDPPKKLALGERAIMADGIEYGVFQLKETGKPVDVIYAAEGSPLIIGPNGVLE